jgi:hypothetical protein
MIVLTYSIIAVSSLQWLKVFKLFSFNFQINFRLYNFSKQLFQSHCLRGSKFQILQHLLKEALRFPILIHKPLGAILI